MKAFYSKRKERSSFLSILILLVYLGLMFGCYCLLGWLFLLLWNWLAVTMLSAPILSYWTCVGIVVALRVMGVLIFGWPQGRR